MPLSNTAAWLFDLDNTLYSPHSDVFPQIHKRMSLFIMQRFGMNEAQAAKRREDYFYTYGTTMRGLMVEHQVDPQEFMDFVHDVGLDAIGPDPRWNQVLRNLPGRKIIFTNADGRHARRILEHLGIATEFPDIFDIAAGDYACKPDEAPYRTLLLKYGLKGNECWMIDDMERNLEPAAKLGMRTVWFRHDADWQRHKPKEAHHYPHCHYVTDDLISFMEKLGTRND
jgi:putative hydrolase of the HAD superfamily